MKTIHMCNPKILCIYTYIYIHPYVMKHACACWCVNVNIYFYTFRLPYLNVKIVAIFVAKLGNVFIESL